MTAHHPVSSLSRRGLIWAGHSPATPLSAPSPAPLCYSLATLLVSPKTGDLCSKPFENVRLCAKVLQTKAIISCGKVTFS